MFKKTIFKNKLRLILSPISQSRAITVLVMVGTGSRYESQKLNGISHFLEHMFFKGTQKRPSAIKISTELDKIGASYNAFTGKELTGFYVKADSRYLDLSLDIISDILLNSKFSKTEINTERGVIREEIKMIQDTPMHYISDLFEKLLYGQSPMGRFIIGTEKNILSFKRSDFLDYYKKHYVAENIVLCIAGDKQKLKIAEKRAQKYFLKMKKGDFLKIKDNQNKETKNNFDQKSPQVLLYPKKTDQAHLSLGVRAYGLKDESRFALKLLAVILGGNMSSRLFTEIREKRGLAYYVRTSHEAYTDRGYLVTQSGVRKDKIKQSIQIILNEYRKISQKGISQEELRKAKDYVKGISTVNLETSDQIANFLANQEILLGRVLTLREHFKKIDKVSRKDIKEVAQDIFQNNKLNLAVIGDYKDKKIFDKILKL